MQRNRRVASIAISAAVVAAGVLLPASSASAAVERGQCNKDSFAVRLSDNSRLCFNGTGSLRTDIRGVIRSYAGKYTATLVFSWQDPTQPITQTIAPREVVEVEEEGTAIDIHEIRLE